MSTRNLQIQYLLLCFMAIGHEDVFSVMQMMNLWLRKVKRFIQVHLAGSNSWARTSASKPCTPLLLNIQTVDYIGIWQLCFLARFMISTSLFPCISKSSLLMNGRDFPKIVRPIKISRLLLNFIFLLCTVLHTVHFTTVCLVSDSGDAFTATNGCHTELQLGLHLLNQRAWDAPLGRARSELRSLQHQSQAL